MPSSCGASVGSLKMHGLWTSKYKNLNPVLPPYLSFPSQQGEVDCWPLACPEVECEFSVLPENECCPRCVTDPCQADTIRNDITKTCLDEMNVVRFTGSSWIKHSTECTLCQCKVRLSGAGVSTPLSGEPMPWRCCSPWVTGSCSQLVYVSCEQRWSALLVPR